MKAIILLNGDIFDYEIIKRYVSADSYIIACDGGLKHCKPLGIIPNVILGDFDSVSHTLLEEYESKSEILRFSKDKDYTDGELGIRKAIEIGSSEVLILGGFSASGRVEHILANMFMLRILAEQNIFSVMLSEKSEVYYLMDEIEVVSDKKFVSIVPLSDEVEVLKSKGLKYDITNDKFTFGSSRSISNEILDNAFYISIKSGKALVITSCD